MIDTCDGKRRPYWRHAISSSTMLMKVGCELRCKNARGSKNATQNLFVDAVRIIQWSFHNRTGTDPDTVLLRRSFLLRSTITTLLCNQVLKVSPGSRLVIHAARRTSHFAASCVFGLRPRCRASFAVAFFC